MRLRDQVPIGPLAWMPGQLVHTNTIKVRLSEEYVVEYSAKQAVGVAQRRRQSEHLFIPWRSKKEVCSRALANAQ